MEEETGISMKVEQTKSKFTLTLDGLGKMKFEDKANVYEKIIKGIGIMLSLEIPTPSEIIPEDESEQAVQQNPATESTGQDNNVNGTQTEDTGAQQVSAATQEAAKEENTTSSSDSQEQGTSSSVKETPVSSGKPEGKDSVQTANEKEPKLEFGKYQTLTASEVVSQYGEEGIKYLKEKILPSLEKNIAKYPANQKKIEYINKAIKGTDKNGDGSLKFGEMAVHIQTMSIECGDTLLKAVDEISKLLTGRTYNDLILSKDAADMETVYDAFCAAVEKNSLKF